MLFSGDYSKEIDCGKREKPANVDSFSLDETYIIKLYKMDPWNA